MIGLAPDQENERPANAGPPVTDDSASPSKQPERPEQSAEDTDTGWGERPDPDDDERFHRDRPPHWGSD